MKTAALRFTTIAVFMTLALAAAATSAWAGQGYESITGTFGKPCETTPCPGGQLDGPTGLAVNYNNGDIYVVDTGDDRVEWFSATGATFEGQFDASGKYEVKGTKKTGTPAPTGKLSAPEGIAIDNDPSSPSYEDVYVADVGHDVIDKFTPTGEYLTQITGGKCENTEETPPCTGSKLTPFEGELNIATDPQGNLWTYEAAPGNVYQYNNKGTLTEIIPELGANGRGAESLLPAFTVDSNGNLYLTAANHRVLEVTAGTHERIIITEDGNIETTLGIISSTGRLLVDEGSSIELYGSPLRVFPSEGLAESGGVAVDGENGEGTLYASERGRDEVAHFEAGAPGAPEILSATAFSKTREKGAFEVVINPNNRNTNYHINYSTKVSANGKELEGEVQTVTGTELPAEFTEDHDTVGGALFENTNSSYYYQVIAENELGETKTEVQVYTKLPTVPPGEILELTSTGATLGCAVSPDFLETQYTFYIADTYQHEHDESGVPIGGVTKLPQLKRLEALKLLEESKGERICPGIAIEGGKGTLPEEVSDPCPLTAEVEGLTPGETYYFRVVATNEVTKHASNANKGAPVDGEWVAFTPYRAPQATGGQATGITSNSAELSGEANPEGTTGSSYFAYITASEYEGALANGAANPNQPGYQAALEHGAPSPYTQGSTTTPVALPATKTTQTIGPILATGLRANTTYHYALIATNQYGLRTYGPDHTFTTQPGTPPTITTGPATNITQTTATLTATITTNGQATTYAFQTTTTPGNYQPPTGQGRTPAGATETISTSLAGLQPATIYYFRITAASTAGTVHGPEGAFTTLALPSLLTVPASLTSLGFVAPPNPPPVKTPTRAERLKKALKQCRKDKRKGARQRCEKAAKKKYGTVKKHRKKK